MTTRPHALAATIVRAPFILRNHFDYEASHAGLRSPDLAGTGSRSSNAPDTAMVARFDRGSVADHRRVRRALQAISAEHANALSLAFGITLRNRDIEDGNKRRAPKASERNWRVRFAELYGIEGAVVLASPKAHRLFERHLRGLGDDVAEALPAVAERVAPLLSPEIGFREGQVEPWKAETAGEMLARSRAAVLPAEAMPAILVYEHERAAGLVAWLLGAGRGHAPAIAADAKKLLEVAVAAFAEAYGKDKPARRGRDTGKTRARILASHAEHGQEIGG